MPKGITVTANFSSVYDAMGEYAKFRKITLPEALKDRAGKLAYRLYAAYAAHAPSLATLRALPLRIIKPRKGRTKAREKAVRISARKYTATGWLAAAVKYGKGLLVHVRVKSFAGGAVEHLDGLRPHIEIFNSTEGSVILDSKYGVIEKCIADDRNDMEEYIQRKADEATHAFNRHK